MIAAVAGVPLSTVGCIIVAALSVGLCVGYVVARPYQLPSDRRRRELERLVEENGVRE